jgi:hypothetical protein
MVCLLLATVGCAAGGCARGPGAFFSGPQEIDSAVQWNVLANHVADRVNRELMLREDLKSSVYVRHVCGPGKCGEKSFPFDEGFNDLLITQLVNFGIPTTAAPEHADLTVEYKVQTIYRSPGFRAWNWPKPGALIALAAGIVVLEDAPWELIAAAAAVDVTRANYQAAGQYEVIITTSILDKKRYMMRFSDVYAINSAEYWHYRQSSGPAQEIRLTGANTVPPPLRARPAEVKASSQHTRTRLTGTKTPSLPPHPKKTL